MLAIAGGKGGCGKTTTALGVAGALAEGGQAPLVVDADSDMPDVHHVGDLPPEPGIDQCAEGAPLDTVTREVDRFPGVRVLTAGQRDHLATGLRRVQQWPGPVLVDCPPGSGPDAVHPLRHADRVLVVTTDEPPCLEDATRTIRTARGLGTQPVGVLTVRRRRSDLPAAVGGCRILATVPFVPDPCANEHVRAGWDQVAKRVSERTETENEGRIQQPERTQPSHPGQGGTSARRFRGFLTPERGVFSERKQRRNL